jgi:hypothetical protein
MVIFEKEWYLSQNVCLDSIYIVLPEIFLILGKMEPDIFRSALTSSYKLTNILLYFGESWIFFADFNKTPPMGNNIGPTFFLMTVVKVRPIKLQLFYWHDTSVDGCV